MISEIILKNFQVHRHLVVDFDPAITTIIGPSDHGKSTILRALRWVCLNQPAGNDFLRHGSKTVSVTLTIGESTLTRSWDGMENVYELNGVFYKAFGRDVPEPVANFLRMSKVNFQGQDDGIFWLSETAGEVSRQLNQIVNLELIDETMKRIGSMLRTARIVATERKERLDEVRSERKRLHFVDRLQTEFVQLRQTGAIASNSRKKAERLVLTVRRVSEAILELSKLREATTTANRAVAAGERAVESSHRSESLKDLLSEIERSASLARTPVPDLARLEAAAESWTKAKRQSRTLLAALHQIDVTMNEIKINRNHLKQIQTKLKELTKGRCPLCGAEMS